MYAAHHRFTSHFSTAVCKATGIQQNISTAFHPRTDGQTEQMNLWIKNYLKEFISAHQNDWSAFLPMAEFAHNSWRHEHTRHTPHELLIGINPTVSINMPEDLVPTAHDQLAELRNMRIHAQQALQRHIKVTTPPCIFTPGDKVWLDARHLKFRVPSKKLAPWRYGPFKVLKQISLVTY